MQPRYRVSRTAIELIKRFEGYRRAAAQLPDGRWTIGHGHTLTARQGAQVSEDDAEALLLYDLIGVSHALNEAVFTPLTQNQFDALASFVFNVGLDNFHQSGVLRRLNEGALLQAACAMELWRKANLGGERVVIDALVRRRSVEKTLFLTPPGEAWVAAPSPILRPLLDTDASDVVPTQTPLEVTAALEGNQLVIVREGEPQPLPTKPEAEEEGPAKQAAEAVSARLSMLFPEPGEEPQSPKAQVAVQVEIDTSPDATGEDPVPFFLRAPDPEQETSEPDEAQDDDEEEGPEAQDLFGGLEPADFGDDLAEPDLARHDPFGRRRFIIDDQAPFDFVPPAVQPLPDRPEGGIFTLVSLAVLGLFFFGGGIFWATYARPSPAAHILGPRLVGGLAGIAGVGFFVVAVYLLLDRLSRATERQARRQH